MAATTTSTGCTSLFTFRSDHGIGDSVPKDRGSSPPACSRLDGVAAWLINGVGAAFFASLDRFSCIRIATEDDFGEEGNDLPLIYNDGNLRRDGGGSGGITGPIRRRKGNKKTGALVLED